MDLVKNVDCTKGLFLFDKTQLLMYFTSPHCCQYKGVFVFFEFEPQFIISSSNDATAASFFFSQFLTAGDIAQMNRAIFHIVLIKVTAHRPKPSSVSGKRRQGSCH